MDGTTLVAEPVTDYCDNCGTPDAIAVAVYGERWSELERRWVRGVVGAAWYCPPCAALAGRRVT